MEKTTVVVSCPIDTYSGYGARARDFVKALNNIEKYDVKVLSQRWGNTSFGYLEDHHEDILQSLIINQVTSQPDVWIQITVPNEFQKIGKYNIGVTAGIETTLCDPSWIKGCNNMDLVLTSSEHSRDVFKKAVFIEQDKQGRRIGEVKLDTKMEVLLEGADLTKYYKTTTKANTELNLDLDGIDESFCFLFVGTWLQGDFGQDRKNIGYMIKSFLETFKNKPSQPALILKTGLGTSSHMNTDEILKKIDSIRSTVKGKLPNIYLLDGDLHDEEMNELYNHPKVKAMVSLTKGEGFGRPLLEFSLTGKPIIASGWSGHLDFLTKEFSTLIGGNLTQVDPSAVQKGVILPEAMWFTPDDGEVAKAYKEVHKNYKKYVEKAKRQAHRNKINFSFESMQNILDVTLEENVPEFPKQVELNLPKLELPKLQ